MPNYWNMRPWRMNPLRGVLLREGNSELCPGVNEVESERESSSFSFALRWETFRWDNVAMIQTLSLFEQIRYIVASSERNFFKI